MNNIKSLNLEIIDICNLRCNMCDIWTNKNENSLNINNIIDILNSKYFDKSTDISLTGGEPLLYKGIENIFLEVNKLGFKINTLSTNGTIFNKLKDLLNILESNNISLPNIHISIDGNEETHDKQRGTKGSFKKSMETILKLKKEFKEINIKIKYTITKNNINNINYVYNLSKKLGTQITYKLVENDDFYTNKTKKIELLNLKEKELIKEILEKIYDKTDKYINNLIYYIENEKLNFKCTTPKENVFIMANGDLFVCTKYKSIGNIKENNIDELINNKNHNQIIKKVDEISCSKCYSLHGAYKTII